MTHNRPMMITPDWNITFQSGAIIKFPLLGRQTQKLSDWAAEVSIDKDDSRATLDSLLFFFFD